MVFSSSYLETSHQDNLSISIDDVYKEVLEQAENS